MWKSRSRENGPKYRNVVARRQYYSASALAGGVGPRRSRVRGSTYLGFVEYRPEAVEQLEWCDDLALDQGAGEKRGGRPPPGADGHLPEPRLQRQPRPISHHWIHDCEGLRPPGRGDVGRSRGIRMMRWMLWRGGFWGEIRKNAWGLMLVPSPAGTVKVASSFSGRLMTASSLGWTLLFLAGAYRYDGRAFQSHWARRQLGITVCLELW